MDFEDVSCNFSIAKIQAIIVVVIGHFFNGLVWIPTTFGLFVFTFSSGFFTSQKYQNSFYDIYELRA